MHSHFKEYVATGTEATDGIGGDDDLWEEDWAIEAIMGLGAVIAAPLFTTGFNFWYNNPANPTAAAKIAEPSQRLMNMTNVLFNDIF